MGLLPENHYQLPSGNDCENCSKPCEDNPFNPDEECWGPHPLVEALVKAGNKLSDIVIALAGGRNE